MGQFNYYRVLEHDRCDQIRIGQTFGSYDPNESAKSVIKGYTDKFENVERTFENGCKEYYNRLAIVNAETLEVVVEIFNSK